MNKKIITIIIALAAVCGCQKTEKTIYRVPLSEHAMELERQEKSFQLMRQENVYAETWKKQVF